MCCFSCHELVLADVGAAALEGETAWVILASTIAAPVALRLAMRMARGLATGCPGVGVGGFLVKI